MGAEVSGQCVSSAAGVAAEGTLEGLLARMQLDVAEQVPLLSERRAALVALKRSLTWGRVKGHQLTSLLTTNPPSTALHHSFIKTIKMCVYHTY